MALDTKTKRFAAAGVGRPYMRSVFPVATPSREWRSNVALTTPVADFQAPGAFDEELLMISHIRNFNKGLTGGMQ